MIALTAHMIEEVLMDVQTELVFFCLAIGTHLLFFSKLNFKRGIVKPKVDATIPVSSKATAAPSATVVAFKAALRASDVVSAMKHFEGLCGLWQECDSPSSALHMLMEQLVKLAAQKGMLPELLELVSKLGLLDKVLNLVFAQCTDAGDAATWRKAEQLGHVQAVKFTAATYQALIKCASISGTSNEASRIMADAKKAGMADVATYSAYVKGLLKNGNMQEVWRTMKAMRAAGLRPNTIAFNGLLGAAVALNPEAAWSMVGEMDEFAVKPDQATCSILLKTVTPKTKASSLEKVMAMLDRLDGNVDEVLLSAVVDASVRVSRADLLIPFLKAHRAVVNSAHTFGSIIRAYGYVQDIRGAWDTWNEMRKQHITPISVTLGCMVEALVTNGDIEGGYELIHEMLRDEKTAPLVNAVMYGSIVKGFSHNKNFSRVWEVYDEMVAQKLQFSMVTFNTLIDTCARSGELSRIPALLKDIDAQGLKMGIVTYSAILKGYCQKNLIDEAFELFDNMTRTTELEPDEIMYNSLVDGCARQGLYDRGMALFEKMRISGVRPSNYTLSVLVKLADRAKKVNKAFEVCEEVSSKYGFRLNVHVFANLVQACLRQRDLPRAVGVLERMLQERVRPDVRTYSLLLRACLDVREPKEAASLLRAAMGLSGTNPVFAKYPKAALQPQGGLPGDLVSEVLLGILSCREDRLAAALLVDLGRCSPVPKIDPKIRLRLAARMAEL